MKKTPQLEMIERMEGIVTIDAKNELLKAAEQLFKDVVSEGFEISDLLEYIEHEVESHLYSVNRPLTKNESVAALDYSTEAECFNKRERSR